MKHRFAYTVSLILALIVLSPLAWIALRAGDSLDPFLNTFTDDSLWHSALKSLLLAVGVALTCSLISLPCAWLTHATDMPARKLFRRLLVLPLAIPSYVSGFVVVATLGPSGISKLFGLPVPDIYSYFGAWAALLFSYPYILLPLQSALTTVDPHRWEAARSLGASPIKAFKDVVWPELRIPTIRGSVIVALYVLSDFGAVSLLRYPSLSFLIYQRYGSPFRRYEAVWYAALLVILAVIFLVIFLKLGGKRHITSNNSYSQWPIIRLGIWRWPAFIFSSSVLVVGALGPLAVVAWWLIRGLINDQTIFNLQDELFNSLYVAVIGAFLITSLGIPPAITMRFSSSKISNIIDKALHLGYAIPGVVVGLAFVYIGSHYLNFIYQTLWLLQLAYIVRFIPQSSSALSDNFLRQDRSLYEASRSLGKSHSRTLLYIVIPVALPALASVFIAIFISIIKELPATLLLKPPGFSTLAYRIWSLTSEAFFTATAPTVFALTFLALLALFVRKDSIER